MESGEECTSHPQHHRHRSNRHSSSISTSSHNAVHSATGASQERDENENRTDGTFDPVALLMNPRFVHVGEIAYGCTYAFRDISSSHADNPQDQHLQHSQQQHTVGPSAPTTSSPSPQQHNSSAPPASTQENTFISPPSSNTPHPVTHDHSHSHSPIRARNWYRNRSTSGSQTSVKQQHSPTPELISSADFMSRDNCAAPFTSNPYQLPARHPRDCYPQYAEYGYVLPFPHTSSRFISSASGQSTQQSQLQAQPQQLHFQSRYSSQIENSNNLDTVEEVDIAVAEEETSRTPLDSSSNLDNAVTTLVGLSPRAEEEEAAKEEDKEEDLCIICMEQPKNASLIHGDSGHIICCIGCANRLKQSHVPCPVCRQDIQLVVKNYY